MSFEINPCKACWKKYKRGDCDINNVNSCVTATAAAFTGVPSNNMLRDNEANTNWGECMYNMMLSEGRTPCDLRLDMAPVWTQAPHYFPRLFNQTKDLESAKQECISMCKDAKFHQNGCVQNCLTDYDAVEMLESPRKVTLSVLNSGDSSDPDIKGGKLGIGSLLAVIVTISIFIFVIRWMKKKWLKI